MSEDKWEKLRSRYTEKENKHNAGHYINALRQQLGWTWDELHRRVQADDRVLMKPELWKFTKEQVKDIETSSTVTETEGDTK